MAGPRLCGYNALATDTLLVRSGTHERTGVH